MCWRQGGRSISDVWPHLERKIRELPAAALPCGSDCDKQLTTSTIPRDFFYIFFPKPSARSLHGIPLLLRVFLVLFLLLICPPPSAEGFAAECGRPIGGQPAVRADPVSDSPRRRVHARLGGPITPGRLVLSLRCPNRYLLFVFVFVFVLPALFCKRGNSVQLASDARKCTHDVLPYARSTTAVCVGPFRSPQRVLDLSFFSFVRGPELVSS